LPNHAEFLAAIRDDPEDDAVRLVFADWLEEHDEPERAELFRVQCRLAGRLPARERASLEARQRALIKKHAGDWLGPFAKDATYRRGTACVRLRTSELLTRKVQEQAATWFPRGFVLGLELDGTSSRWQQLFALPLLAGLQRLSIDHSKLRDDGVAILAASPQLAGLTDLAVQDGGSFSKGLTDRGVRAILDSPHLQRLNRLDFRLNSLDADAVRLLTSRTPGRGLLRLRLDWTSLRGKLLDCFLEAPWLEGLTELSLYNCLKSEAAVARLVASPRIARLERLDLGHSYLTDEGVRAVAESPHLANLRWLSLRFAEFTEAGARALARSPHLEGLEFLDVYYMSDEPLIKVLRKRFGKGLFVNHGSGPEIPF
jgi:uncharacterized protein (TIGR02996 family)